MPAAANQRFITYLPLDNIGHRPNYPETVTLKDKQ
jgi:hypothetical protein